MSRRKTPDPVMAKLSCRHTVEVIGRAEGDRVPRYVCPATKSGAGDPHRQATAGARQPVPAVKGPPPRCPGAGQRGLDGRKPGALDRCPVCTQDMAVVRRDGTLGSHRTLG